SLLALCLAYGLDEAGLGHTAEIVVDRWRPPGGRDVEVDGPGNAVGMSEYARTPIPRLMNRVDAQCHAMREQRLAAVGIECDECVPQLARLPRQLLGPTMMPVVDGLRNGGVLETRRLVPEHDALHIDLNARLGRAAVEELETEGLERREQRDVRILSKRIAQGERAVRRELGHQTIGDGLQALVFLWLLLVRGATDLRLRAFDRGRIDSACVRRASLRLRFGNGWLVLRPYISALHARDARAIDADERASTRDLLGIITSIPTNCARLSEARTAPSVSSRRM